MIEERPIGAGLSRNLGSTTAPGESVEHELTAFIEKRDKQRRLSEGERATEEAWAESERRHNACRREENRAARVERVEYHGGQAARLAATLGALVSHHEAKATELLEEAS